MGNNISVLLPAERKFIAMTKTEKILLEQDFETYSDTVLRIAIQNTKNYHDAEDIVQEVFIRLAKIGGENAFRDESHKKAWIIRVTVNVCRDLNRFAVFRRYQPLEECPYISTDGGMERCELLELIRKLPEAKRNAVYLFYYEGMTIEEIAEATGKSPGTVGSDLHRARKLLRLELED